MACPGGLSKDMKKQVWSLHREKQQAKVLKKKKVQTEDSLDEIYELIGAM